MDSQCCFDSDSKQSDEAQSSMEEIGEINTDKTGQGKSAIVVLTVAIIHFLPGKRIGYVKFSNFTGEGPVRSLRNMYTRVDSHIPIRFQEDLATGYLDFHDYIEDLIDSTVFTSIIDAFPCHQGHEHNRIDDKTCTKYNSQTLRHSWSCDNPRCS